MQIPFNKPYFTGNELKYIEDLFNSVQNGENGSHLSGDGKYTHKAQEFMETKFGAKKALLTTSGTSALELASHALDFKPGDEVIVPSYTFSSTVNAILLAGAKPIFADIQEDTLNIDPEDIRRKLTPKTKAIYPVHYAGVSCDMKQIMEIAAENDLKVVEDAAQGVNAKYKDKYLGTIGDFGCYSFHETKNYVCGEGGALLINTDDQAMAERVEIIREKGTDRSKFFRGEVDKYTWVDLGSSYLPSDILAAFLYAQLEKLDEIQEKRMKVWNAYYDAFKPFEDEGKIRLPIIHDYTKHNAHMFYILFEDNETRNNFMNELKKKGINSVFHYIPLHSAPFGLKLGNNEGDLPVTEDISKKLLRLPLYAGMNDEELEYLLTCLMEKLKKL
ncbi:dTDP-4-amino-4,6-dideoxygalactose transaminase [Methanosarcina sp. WWM596]|uniref:dTDP-4-amino-4,6-dideoxygalactose transaminase n=1 Tax=Methanosarcina sp. WWM596 TaxID=1434103 RepID=UPI0006160AEE|nr:dTDP-4-amino-4,6-dideoxygalactose transaminase [Methanosarcina sp. WWM596]AKB18850.1 4-keto-6-deoxy-N-Acetyl-D-hexosaminyl-(Lipid carrier) aminotransferase [Methanosarcina sp. WWM596]